MFAQILGFSLIYSFVLDSSADHWPGWALFGLSFIFGGIFTYISMRYDLFMAIQAGLLGGFVISCLLQIGVLYIIPFEVSPLSHFSTLSLSQLACSPSYVSSSVSFSAK